MVTGLFDTTGFPPRWQCGTWSEGLGWLHIGSDIAIFGAYTAIPCVLAFFVLRRKDVPFPAILWLFVAFIFACGFGHLLEAIIFWKPVYRFAGASKFFTASVSWATVLALVKITPQALHLPGLAKLNNELRDEIDERKRAEEAVRRSEVKLQELLVREREARSDAEMANRIKDEFLSTVSHELRTPLNAILGYAQLLLRESKDDSEHEGLAVIERNAKVQAQIIEDLLDMSRIISGKVRLDVRSVDLGEVIEAAIATVKPAVDAKGIRLNAVLDPTAGPVLGDGGRLQQVLWNLLTNAVKFTPKGGRIQVSMARVDSHLEVEVSDNGEGISPEFQPYVFERFRQADGGTTRRHGGLGLGLSIVKQLVELHGGSVDVKSGGEGQGSTFIVRLPVRAMRDDAPNDRRRSTSHVETDEADVDLKGIRVLVVDDEVDARELARRLLVDFGAEVEVADSVDDALEKFKKWRPDVLLSDIGMPEKDGYELMRAVRALGEADGGEIPAVALTAFARSDDRKRAMFAGYQGHLTKPVDPAELVATLATLTGRTGR
jgi:signal transduction histidine kinase/CheY-like chemotaxis protein